MDPATNSLRYAYFNSDWQKSGPVTNDASTDRVGLAAFKNDLYCVYQRADQTLYAITSTDGSTWGQATPISNVSDFTYGAVNGPGLAVLRNSNTDKLCCSYAAGGYAVSLVSNDGAKWSGPSSFGSSDSSSTLAVFNEKFWSVNLWEAAGSYNITNIISSDGLNWPNYINNDYINFASTDSGSALVYSPVLDALICVFGGEGSHLFYSINTTNDPTKWTSPTIINGPQRAPGTSVGVAEVDGVIYVAYCNAA
ncbi:hypothetical protein [Brucella endophytica]|uniref:hypothetical protein n=1 Tax=Brucella endophytica TaxID=1963359 RepID=UPI00166679AD|nr:hypothetical protein [Brucella endophytica]